MLIKIVLASIFIITLFSGIYLYTEFKKVKEVVYTHIEKEDGKDVAENVNISPTLNYTRDFGYKLDINNYKEYTGLNETIYFYMKKDVANNWYINSIKTEP